jgi:hypothetical protein
MRKKKRLKAIDIRPIASKKEKERRASRSSNRVMQGGGQRSLHATPSSAPAVSAATSSAEVAEAMLGEWHLAS